MKPNAYESRHWAASTSACSQIATLHPTVGDVLQHSWAGHNTDYSANILGHNCFISNILNIIEHGF